ncbi:hepatocyte growth factor-like protein [Pecten maximus]|uniref:hepatocyte growth factor-like protein n=1 Tax=Pecten maximus TaxID=6579 RepID=UPI00145852AF|nr:hepatocyte growth factor-like protein [Pecten maximus]
MTGCDWRTDECAPTLKDFRGNYTAQHPFMGDDSLVRYRCTTFNDHDPVAYCPISRCGMLSTPASLSCSANDIFDIKNPQYEGMVSCTVKGVTCQRWDTNEPHQSTSLKDRSDLHNWCRQSADVRPWCYTTDPETRWDYCPVEERLACDISPPKTLSVIDVTLERPYMDLLSVGRYRCDTLENKEPEESCPMTRCLSDGSWSTANISCSDKECYDPTNQLYNGRVTCTVTGITCQRWDSEYPHPEAGYVGQGSDHGNRCQMSGRIRPWCFTMNPEVKWDFCPVDKCT